MMDELAVAYAGKTVAITGASGYLAGALLVALGSAPGRTLLISRQTLKANPAAENIQGDVRTASSWLEIVSRADVIFHLAGNTSVYAALEDPAGSLAATVQPLAHLVAACRTMRRRPRVVLAGTATQYGLTNTFPVNESIPPRPITNYDLHKQFAEEQLLLATRQRLLNGVSLRLANVYGPSSSESAAGDRGILNKIAKMAMHGATLQVYGGGGYLRDYVYVADVARAFLAVGIADAAVGRAFNVASGIGTSVREAFHSVARRVENATGNTIRIEDVPWPAGADPIEFRNFVGDVSALTRITDWRPLVSLEEGVDQIVRHSLESVGERAP